MKRLAILIIAILVLTICLTGCTDEDNLPPPAPEPQVFSQPGGSLVAYGDVTGNGQLGGELVSGTIDTITVTVGLAPGADPIDMEKISIVYADAVRSESIIPVEGYRGEPPAGTWGILTVWDQVGKDNNRLEDKEKFLIRINPKSPLVPRQLITISIRTPSGNP